MEFELNELELTYVKRIRKVRTFFILQVIGALLLVPLFAVLVLGFGGKLSTTHELDEGQRMQNLLIFFAVTIVCVFIPFLITYFVRLF